MKGIAIIFIGSISLSGCATFSPDLPMHERDNFFKASQKGDDVTLYLACGKHYVNGELPLLASENNPACGFTINSVKYSLIRSGEVGKITTKGGAITVDNIDGMDPLKTIHINPGTAALLVSDWNQIYNQTAMMFGAAGAIYDATTTDKSRLNGPLRIYTGDYSSQISGLTPVKMIAIRP